MRWHRRIHRRWVAVGVLLAVLLAGMISGLVTSQADASPVLRTVTVGHAPYWTLALDEQTTRAFVFNRQDGTVSVLNTHTGALLRTVTLTTSDAWIAVAKRAGRVFVSSYQAGTITMLDARTGRVLQIVRDGNDLGVAVDEQTNHVFVGTASGLTLLDARSGAVLRRLPVCGEVFAVAVSVRTGHVFAKCDDRTIAMLDAHTGHRMHVVPDQSGQYGTLVVDEQTNRVFGLGNQPAMDVLDAQTGAYLRTISIDPSSNAPVIDARTGRAYLGLGNANTNMPPPHTSEAVVLNGKTGTILHHIPIAGNPSALVVDPHTGHVLVGSIGPLDPGDLPTGTGTLSILDAGSGRVVRSVRIGLSPSDVAIDGLARRVLVVNSGSDSHGKGTLKTWQPAEGWWARAIRKLKQTLGWLPITVPPRPAPTTNGTVTTLDLTRL